MADSTLSSRPLSRPLFGRRTMLGAGLAGMVAAGAGPALSKGLREWRMVTSWPKGLPGLGAGAEHIGDLITRNSGGRITVKTFSGGELVPALGVFDAVAEGTAQMGHDASYYHTGKSEGTAFFTAFPWGLTADEFNGWILHGNGQKLWDDLYLPFGLRGFIGGNTGTQMFGWFKKEINTVADLKGLKFRAPGNQGKVLTRLGGTAVLMAGGEIFPALQSGAIDGAEWVGPYNDLSLGFYQVCPYYYSPGYHEAGANLQVTVNEKEWQSLDTELRGIVSASIAQGASNMQAEYAARSGPALRTLIKDHGVQLRHLPEPIIIATMEAASDILTEVYEASPTIVRQIIDDMLAYRQAAQAWTRVGVLAFENSRRLGDGLRLKR